MSLRLNDNIDDEHVRWRAKPCGWHRRDGTLRNTLFSLVLATGFVLLALESVWF